MPAQRPGRSKQDYSTPPEFIAAVLARLDIDRFQHDFAATARNSKGETYWDRDIDSLSVNAYDWADVLGPQGWGWLNPPYATIQPWVRAAYNATKYGAHIAMLVPASVGSNWFKRYVHDHAQVLFLNGRIEFIPGQPYPKDCMLILWGATTPNYDVWSWRQSII
jgi:site-specific DNA-methyltransferase (adenine-specific)